MARVMDENYVSRGFRVMFYMVTPNESSFQHVDEVPQYVQQATPFFICLIFLEVVLGWMKNRVPIITVSDGITSISAGMISRLPGLFMRSCELTGYIYVWDHYHLVELPWDSAWTWWLSFLGVDFCFYWMHRLAHEVAFIWAAHQVHHSSEYYNLSTALRQTITQPFTSWVFYLPMALALPPSVFAVHIQFNLIYQFWIHTELIRDLGPLEWILNTPSHHRVHHGRNLYCIDKNYGGALIIWDRLFGTFAPETEKVVYGLVSPIKTFEAVSVQVTREEVPFESSWSLASQVYVVIHFLLVLGFYHNTFEAKMALSQLTVLAMAGYILLSLTSLGFLIDQRPKAAVLETLRFVVMVMMLRYGHMKPLVTSMAMPIEAFVSLSLLFWVLQSVSQLVGIKNKSD